MNIHSTWRRLESFAYTRTRPWNRCGGSNCYCSDRTLTGAYPHLRWLW